MENGETLSRLSILKERLRERLEYWKGNICDEDVMDFSIYDLSDAVQEMNSFKLYRYSSASLHSIRNIEKQQIHLTANGKFNDIYEGMPYGLSGKVSLFDARKLGDLAYISCLTETNTNTLMWAHYANAHKGFCIEYDLKCLKESPFSVMGHIFPVFYEDVRPYIRDIPSLISSHRTLRECIEKQYVYDDVEPLDNIMPLFLTKAKCWEHEHEWRIIYTLKQLYDINNASLNKNKSIPFPCITGVYLGYRIDPDVRENIIEICKRLSHVGNQRVISVYQAGLSDARYDIQFERII